MTPWIRWDAANAPAEPAWRWLAQSLGMPALLATPARPQAELTVPPSRIPQSARQKLAALLEGGLRLDDAARLSHAANAEAADALRLRGGDLSRIPDAVFGPRSEDELLALLKICGETGIAVGGPSNRHPAFAALELNGMAQIESLDAVSGLAQVQGGIGSAELKRQLAARGMVFNAPEFDTLGCWIARGIGTEDVRDVRLATPRGMLSGNLLPSRFGIVSAATLQVHAVPASTVQLHYLFPDFASGLAALRETRRERIAYTDMQLSDGDQTMFLRNLAAMLQTPSLMQRLIGMMRNPHLSPEKPAAFGITINGAAADVDIARKRFAALTKRLGGSPAQVPAAQDYVPLLLDRGVTVDRIHTGATWSQLPVLYAALRSALDRATRRHAPRTDAHGLVLTQITGARHDGADLTCTFLYPRQLNAAVDQAQAIRRAARDVLAAQGCNNAAPKDSVQNAIQALLDPAGILR